VRVGEGVVAGYPMKVVIWADITRVQEAKAMLGLDSLDIVVKYAIPGLGSRIGRGLGSTKEFRIIVPASAYSSMESDEYVFRINRL